MVSGSRLLVVTNKRNRRLNSHTVCHATRSFRAPCAEAKKAGGSRARAVSSRAVPRASPLRGAQYIALDVRAHHPHDVRRGRRVPRVRAPAGRARRVACRQARREHRRRPGRDARGRRALGAVGPHRRHGRYAGIGFPPRRRRRRASNERRNAGKSVGLSRRASLGPPPVARRPPLSTSAARDEASIRSNDSSRFFSIAVFTFGETIDPRRPRPLPRLTSH